MREKGIPRIPFSQFGIRKDAYFLPGIEAPRDINLIEGILGLLPLMKAGAIEIFEQNHELVNELVRERSRTPLGLVSAVLDLCSRAAHLEISERASNGLRLRMLDEEKEPSGYARQITNAREDPTLRDHAHDHERHVKRIIRLFFLSFAADLTVYPEMTDGLGLYPQNHDPHQLLAAQWNAQGSFQKVEPKYLHAEYGAAMVGTQVNEYALERHISIERAQRSINVAKLLILIHADPKRARERLTGRKKAYTFDAQATCVPILDSELLEAWRNYTLDATSISDSQLFTIISGEQKVGKGKFPTETGLHPLFTSIKERKILDRQLDTAPWFFEISDEYREMLSKTASIALLADLLPMIYPATIAHIRKLNVEKASSRAIFLTSSKEEFSSFVMGKDGDISPDDFGRAMWEFVAVADEFLGMGFEKHSAIYNMVMDVVVYGILETRTYFKHLMNGEEGPAFIQKSFIERIQTLGVKSLRRAGFGGHAFLDLQQRIQELSTADEIHTFIEEVLQEASLNQKGNTQRDHLRVFHLKFHHMMKDMQQTIERLLAKPGNINNSMKTYSPEDFKVLDERTNFVLDAVGSLFGLSKYEVTKIVNSWKDGVRAQLPGVGTYDSIGLLLSAKTLTMPPSGRKQILEGMEKFSD